MIMGESVFVRESKWNSIRHSEERMKTRRDVYGNILGRSARQFESQTLQPRSLPPQ